MKSPFLIQKIINTPMMIQPDKLEVIFDVLDKHVIAASSDWDGGTDGNDSILAIENGVAIISICGTLVNRDYGMNALSGLTSYDDIGEAFDAALAVKLDCSHQKIEHQIN